MTDSLTIDRQNDIVVLTMDDGKANALGPDLSAAISAAVADAEADPTVAAVVLAGREGRFSAGFNLDIIASGDQQAVGQMVNAGGSLVHQLYGCGVPVVAACTGHAVAAGALMLLGCDLRVGPDAPVKIGLNEVAIGMVLPGWALAISRERLSQRHRQRSVANAHLFDGNGAVDAGFLDMAVEPDLVLETAIAEAKALASLDRSSYAKTVTQFRSETLDAMTADLSSSNGDL